jgi:hypothetical protein
MNINLWQRKVECRQVLTLNTKLPVAVINIAVSLVAFEPTLDQHVWPLNPKQFQVTVSNLRLNYNYNQMYNVFYRLKYVMTIPRDRDSAGLYSRLGPRYDDDGAIFDLDWNYRAPCLRNKASDAPCPPP